jgi:hypothetical protein
VKAIIEKFGLITYYLTKIEMARIIKTSLN